LARSAADKLDGAQGCCNTVSGDEKSSSIPRFFLSVPLLLLPSTQEGNIPFSSNKGGIIKRLK